MDGPRATDSNGRNDFNFLHGYWTVHNRRLQNPLDQEATDWQEFRTEVENRPVLGGLGNVDFYRSEEFPSQAGWEALALRLFDPEDCSWRIWWVSTSSPGHLDTPVAGRFTGDEGLFRGDDVIRGRAVKVVYEWGKADADHPRWRQSFSFDGGQTWRANWIMD